jgi:hypothetical protein
MQHHICNNESSPLLLKQISKKQNKKIKKYIFDVFLLFFNIFLKEFKIQKFIFNVFSF